MKIVILQNNKTSLQKVSNTFICCIIGLLLMSCGSRSLGDIINSTTTETITIAKTENTSTSNSSDNTTSVTTAGTPAVTPAVTESLQTEPSNTPTTASIQPTPTIPPTPEPLTYNLPQAVLTSESMLYVSPNSDEVVMPVTLPAGEQISVWGMNNTQSWLRILWNSGIGWVPVSATDYNGNSAKMKPLPILRDPPGCAYLLTTQYGLNTEWISNDTLRVAAVVDLFRSKYGNFPPSSLSLTVNGQEVTTSRREIKEQGQFLLKDIVFSLPDDLQPGDTLGYLFQTPSNEPFTFMATLFGVPDGCHFEE